MRSLTLAGGDEAWLTPSATALCSHEFLLGPQPVLDGVAASPRSQSRYARVAMSPGCATTTALAGLRGLRGFRTVVGLVAFAGFAVALPTAVPASVAC